MLDKRSESVTSVLWAGYWWAVLLRGAIAVVFGVLVFAWPAVTFQTLVFLFGGYALLDGVLTLATAIGGRHTPENHWLPVLESLVSVWVSIVILRDPAAAAFALVFFVSIWAMTTGFLRVVTAIHPGREISGEPWLALSGVLSVLFAFMLMLRPALGVIGVAWVISGFALAMAVALIMLGVELRASGPISHRPRPSARPSSTLTAWLHASCRALDQEDRSVSSRSAGIHNRG